MGTMISLKTILKHDPAEADRAWRRTLGFLGKYLR